MSDPDQLTKHGNRKLAEHVRKIRLGNAYFLSKRLRDKATKNLSDEDLNAVKDAASRYGPERYDLLSHRANHYLTEDPESKVGLALWDSLNGPQLRHKRK